jgi:hypothetical protein
MLHDMGDNFVVYLHQVNLVSESQAENVLSLSLSIQKSAFVQV